MSRNKREGRYCGKYVGRVLRSRYYKRAVASNLAMIEFWTKFVLVKVI